MGVTVNHGGEKSVSTIELNSLFRRSHIQNKGEFSLKIDLFQRKLPLFVCKFLDML